MFVKITPEKANVREWLSVLGSAAEGENYKKFYKQAYRTLAVPSRSRKPVMLYKIDKHTKEGDNVLVPTKLLSTGKLSHRVNISVLECSEKAASAIKNSGSRLVDIKEMVGSKKIHLIV